jgi:hypothetical protein
MSGATPLLPLYVCLEAEIFNTLAETIEKCFLQHIWYERGRKMAVIYSRAWCVESVLQCPCLLKENLGVFRTA